MKNFYLSFLLILLSKITFSQTEPGCPDSLTITTTVCVTANEVRLTGPFWSWDPTGGPIALDNGDGTWTFTFCPAPPVNMEYLLVVDGVQENLVNAPHPDLDGDGFGDLWECSPITDYFSYANRLWVVGSGNVTNTYATCGSCPVPGCTDPTAANYNPAADTDDGSCFAPMVNLFFSEYAEGSSNNKYLEIYNPTSNTVDLSAYAFPSVNNAPTTPGVYEFWNSFPAGAQILANDVYVIAHPSADATILAQADHTHLYLSNGDDGYALVYGANPGSPVDPATGGYVIVDFVGDWNADPGTGWSVAGVSNATANHTLVRKCDVTQGNNNWTLSAGIDLVNSEWVVLENDDWTNLGVHTSPCASISGCTDSIACNYNPDANVSDTCIYPPEQPTLACYEEAFYDPEFCEWVVIGDMPEAPPVECYQTATFNAVSCAWIVIGDMPEAPPTECYQTATFNADTCVWVVSGAPTVVTDTVSSVGSYEWSINGVTYDTSGTYTFIAPDSVCITFVLIFTSTAGINEELSSQINLFPNPTSGNVIISFPMNEEGNLSVYDTQGKLVHSSALKSGDEINLSQKSPGVYTFKINLNDKIHIQRIIKN
jgi:hypothetical protein